MFSAVPRPYQAHFYFMVLMKTRYEAQKVFTTMKSRHPEFEGCTDSSNHLMSELPETAFVRTVEAIPTQ